MPPHSDTRCKLGFCKARSAFSDTDIDPLALPKGKKVECEVCQSKRCRYHCPRCKAYFYCSAEHRARDHNAIHQYICKRLQFLNRPTADIISNEQRDLAKRQNHVTMTDIVNISKDLASASLLEERIENALDQLRVAFHFGLKIYGERSLELIELFGFMADTYIRMGEYSKAIEQQEKAEYIIKDNAGLTSCHKYRVLADFYKHEGLILQAQSKFSDAVVSFANEVYNATMAFHSEHVRVGIGLFHLGTTFDFLKKHDIALSHFVHTTDIWLTRYHDEIKHILDGLNRLVALTSVGTKSNEERNLECSLTSKEKFVSQFIMNHIRDYIENNTKPSKNTKLYKAKVYCVIGMVSLFLGDPSEAGDLALKTKIILHDVDDNRVFEAAKDLHRVANRELNKKDFKSVSHQFKNMAKMRRRTLTIEETNMHKIEKFVETARQRSVEHHMEKTFGRGEQKNMRRKSTRRSIFGFDGYTLEDGQIIDRKRSNLIATVSAGSNTATPKTSSSRVYASSSKVFIKKEKIDE